MGVKPIDTTEPNVGGKKDALLLAAGKENTGDLSQSSVSLNSKIGTFFFFFFFLPVPVSCRSSQARDQTQATAVTVPDP